jgi:hypothetical protein
VTEFCFRYDFTLGEYVFRLKQIFALIHRNTVCAYLFLSQEWNNLEPEWLLKGTTACDYIFQPTPNNKASTIITYQLNSNNPFVYGFTAVVYA